METNFEFFDEREPIENQPDLIQAEIAYQLKRIADALSKDGEA